VRSVPVELRALVPEYRALDRNRVQAELVAQHRQVITVAYGARLDTGTGHLHTTELAAFVTPQALITVRKDDGLDIGAVVERWDASPDLAVSGVGYLLYGLKVTSWAAIIAVPTLITGFTV
jgi:magnesium transporter